MKVRYKVYERDGAVYRGPLNRSAVCDIQRSDGSWEPYAGDRVKPAHFGDFLGVQEFDEPDGKL
jgi:hypothetical protein